VVAPSTCCSIWTRRLKDRFEALARHNNNCAPLRGSRCLRRGYFLKRRVKKISCRLFFANIPAGGNSHEVHVFMRRRRSILQISRHMLRLLTVQAQKRRFGANRQDCAGSGDQDLGRKDAGYGYVQLVDCPCCAHHWCRTWPCCKRPPQPPLSRSILSA